MEAAKAPETITIPRATHAKAKELRRDLYQKVKDTEAVVAKIKRTTKYAKLMEQRHREKVATATINAQAKRIEELQEALRLAQELYG